MMIVRFLLRLTLLFGVAVPLQAQQRSLYSQWLLNPYIFNPAYAGSEVSLVANAIYRSQWVDLPGAPETQQINAHLPVNRFSSGVGVRIERDATGPHQTTLAVLSYNYQWEINNRYRLHLGVSGGYQQYLLDGTALRTPDGQYTDQSLQHNDPYLSEGRVTAGSGVVEAGLWFDTESWAFGVSTQPAAAPALRVNSDGLYRLQPAMHFMVQSFYRLELKDNLMLKPGVLVITDTKKTQAEISLMAQLNKKYIALIGWRGFTGKSRDALIIGAGLDINDRTTAVYSFDIPQSALSAVQRGSHELTLRYRLNNPIGTGKLPPIIYNPRFF
jgi:type IX secretion system PorP/SprF family membrane protein